MCQELEKQMQEMLKGSKPTITTKAINILAMDIDKKFANVDVKLDNILELLKTNKADTDKRIDKLQTESTERCAAHKVELTKKLKELDKDVETINYFTNHPKILKTIAVAILAIAAFALGHSNLLDILKFIK